jgi:hypothetical protein
MWGHTVSTRNALVTFDPVFVTYLTGPPTQTIPATLASVVSCSTDMYRLTIRPFFEPFQRPHISISGSVAPCSDAHVAGNFRKR